MLLYRSVSARSTTVKAVHDELDRLGAWRGSRAASIDLRAHRSADHQPEVFAKNVGQSALATPASYQPLLKYRSVIRSAFSLSILLSDREALAFPTKYPRAKTAIEIAQIINVSTMCVSPQHLVPGPNLGDQSAPFAWSFGKGTRGGRKVNCRTCPE
jgi:hypothetical protein